MDQRPIGQLYEQSDAIGGDALTGQCVIVSKLVAHDLGS